MIRFAAFYGAAAVMGFTPLDVREMSLWQFQAASTGYADAHSPRDKRGLSEAEFDALSSRLDAQ